MNKWLDSLERIVASNRVNPFDVLAPGRESHIKVMGMLVVSLRGVNCIFWFHLRCLGRNVTICARSPYVPIQVSLKTVHKEIYKKMP